MSARLFNSTSLDLDIFKLGLDWHHLRNISRLHAALLLKPKRQTHRSPETCKHSSPLRFSFLSEQLKNSKRRLKATGASFFLNQVTRCSVTCVLCRAVELIAIVAGLQTFSLSLCGLTSFGKTGETTSSPAAHRHNMPPCWHAWNERGSPFRSCRGWLVCMHSEASHTHTHTQMHACTHTRTDLSLSLSFSSAMSVSLSNKNKHGC